jgi:hypothetical protein
MTTRYTGSALLAILWLLWPTAPAEGQVAAMQKRLAAATTLRCTFSTVATGTWKGGTSAAEVAAATITVAFSNVNVDDGTAEAEGTFGAGLIVVRYSNDYLHLMQMHGSGPLYLTTVLARETEDGRLMAVHTRHEYTDVRLPGFTSRPEMYVGDCAIGE